MTFSHLEKIAHEFAIAGNFLFSEEIDSGLINNTFLATFEKPSGRKKKYIFQRINENVFTEPKEVMQNVERITRHINWKVMRVKRNMGGQTLNLYPARGGNFYIKGDQGGIWRCYNYIEGSTTFDECENEKLAYESARAFGAFLDLVSDFDPSELHETIIDFHHTIKRYDNLMHAVRRDSNNRAAKVSKELSFIQHRKSLCSELLVLQKSGELPTRVTHNDTKINNVMMDEDLQEAVCVIDLDTVMAGLSAYDFGDLVRTAVSRHEEDSPDLSKVVVRPSYFEALAKGYVDGCPDLTDREIEVLPLGGIVITLEVGIRFLTDYLEGDVYFRTTREGQNLDRCRTQLKLVEELENHAERFSKFVRSLKK